MAKPYKRRLRRIHQIQHHKERIYISGFSTKAQAKLDELTLIRSQTHHSFGQEQGDNLAISLDRKRATTS